MSATQNPVKQELASQAGHWYAQDGSPAYTIQGKNGKWRPTTLRDAKKLNLVPSVTTVMNVFSKPGLEIWKQTQLLEAALTLPKRDDEGLDAYALRVINDSKDQGRKAADRGTEIHAQIEEWIKEHRQGILDRSHCVTEKLESPLQAFQTALFQIALTHQRNIGVGKDAEAEKSFTSPLGYGGKTDLVIGRFVGDIKTKKNWDDDSKLAYEEHCCQLAAYAAGLKIENPILANIFISTEAPYTFHVHFWEESERLRYWRVFLCALTAWKLKNGYMHEDAAAMLAKEFAS